MTEEVTALEADQEAPPAAVAEQQPTRDFEREAREIGWVPENDFKGDKEKWKPAQKFVEDGERILPIVKANERRLREELAKERQSIAERMSRLEKVHQNTIEAQERQHKADMNRILREQRAAVQEGDVEKFDTLEKERANLKAPEKIELPAQEPVDPGAVFKKANPWYGEDEDLTAFADGVSQAYLAKHPNASLDDNLRYTADKVKAAFPGKFSKPKAAATNGHAAVDGGGDFPGSVSSDPLAKLPAEARAQAARDMKQFPGTYKSAADWIKVYNS
jgi:hypothetical protein